MIAGVSHHEPGGLQDTLGAGLISPALRPDRPGGFRD